MTDTPVPAKKPVRRVNRRHHDTALLKTIGDRMRKARELNCFSQTDAAKLLGYQNSSKLSKIEKAANSKNVPLSVLMKAASIYQVSLDYLFGRSDDWGSSSRATQQREAAAWVFDEWEKARRRDMEVLRKLNDRMSTIDGAIEVCVDQAFAVDEALSWFVSHNRKRFTNDMPGGARLLSAAEKLVSAAKESRASLRRYRMECRSVREPSKSQGDLFEEADDGAA